MALRRTKIIATIGPASEQPQVLRDLLLAGVNLVRINMSHGTVSKHEAVIANVRAIADELQLAVGILLDLQGPKIRIAKFKQGEVVLEAGDNFILDAALLYTPKKPRHPSKYMKTDLQVSIYQ